MAEHTAELNAVIARWLGWIKHDYDCKWSPWEDPADHRMHSDPPAYAGDLNAWNDIYKRFRADRWTTSSAFLKQLLADLDVDDVTGDYGWLTMIFATARQRAEALVRVIGGGE